ncbi:DUF3870 domain-containing protein [Moorella sulfitireducens (nom. illeg.)]|uniref:DUF3870 domain-containing protein n=1 Tax=Neomoorella sulfitireducens TaxID=2972948 RepID=UPI0021AC30D9|nr:DUF3870 domain-containing protein [Moorella sulfitireducens]
MGAGGKEPGEKIFFTAYAKLPTTITAHKLYDDIVVGVEVATQTGEIVDFDCTLATDLARRFVRELVMGYTLNEGIEGLIERVERYYFGSARKALITAFKIIYEKHVTYQQSLANKNR